MDFIERAAEVFQSEVTLQYWMMNCAFKSFEGKNTQVQSMIVEDINNKEVVGPDMNVDALATKYAEYLSTLNAGQVVNKVNAQDKLSSYCGHTGDAAIECPKRLREYERR